MSLSSGWKRRVGANSRSTRSAMAAKARPASLWASTAAIGRPSSPPARSCGDERDLAEQRDLEALRELVATAVAEELVALAVVAGEPGHVLDHALDRQVHLLGHERGPLRHLLRGRLGRGDDVDLGVRQELREGDRDVAGARREVDEQEVGVVPVDVGEELLERLVEHRTTPDDRLVLLGEEAHRDAAHAVGLGRHEHAVEDDRRAAHTEHPRDREAPDVGVDHRDALATSGEGDRQVRGDRRLADAALARGDEQHPGAARGVGEGDRATLARARGRAGCRRWRPGRRGGSGGAPRAPRRS